MSSDPNRDRLTATGPVAAAVAPEVVRDRDNPWPGYIATNFLGHGAVNPKANESDD